MTNGAERQVRWRALIPAVVFMAVAGLFLVAVFGGDPSRVPSPLIGRDVPEFDLPPVAGLDMPGLSSRDFGQGQAVIVNVWASWCVPCRQEHAVLSELRTRTDAPLYGLNYKDTGESARRFLSELGNPFDRIGVDAKGRVAIDWGVYGVPETYVIDGNGRIAFKHVGPLTPDMINTEILPALKAASVP
tara:strand:- start:41276 stop:41839 length:564 start_codon:yes stop_codon:yes gene_type:complete